MKNHIKQKGSLIIIAILILFVVSSFMLAIMYMFDTSIFNSSSRFQAKKVYYIAESGLAMALNDLSTGTKTCNQLNNTIQTFEDGEFKITTQYYNTSSDLELAISAAETSIKVGASNIGNYSPSGKIVIDREVISYTGSSGDFLTGATRGDNGTINIAHNTTEPITGEKTQVIQEACVITSLGAIPSTSSPNIQASNTLQTHHFRGKSNLGKAVGEDGAIYNLDGGTWTQETSGTTKDLWWISCTSLNNCWAVGNDTTFLHYNGTSWSMDSYNPSPTWYDLYGGYCVGQNNCWAVGQGGKIHHYDGNNWSFNADVGSSSLTEITCVDADDCWTVGIGGIMHHYDGTSWSGDQSPGGTPSLYGLTCLDSNDCWTSGNEGKVYHYDGSSWSLSLDTGDNSQSLYEVTCANPTDCWALGEPYNGQGQVYHYDGSSWTSADLPHNDTLRFAMCFSPTACWAVGHNGVVYYYNGSDWNRTQIIDSGSVDLQCVTTVSLFLQPVVYDQKELVND